MKFKKTLLVFCLIICVLFCVSSVAAGDVNDAAIASEKQNVIENQDPVAASEATTEVDNEKMENDVISSSNEEILNTKDNGSFTALQEKINNADENTTITLENDYVYDEGFTTSGITVSKSLTIDGNNHILDAKSKSRIFKLNSNNIVLKNIILIGGSYSGDGGAIYSTGDNCIITSCDFANCSATGSYSVYAGAIYNSGANCTIISCDFANCRVTGYDFIIGGAIYNKGDNCIISSCDFANCSATNKYSGHGGAIYNMGSNCNISSCDFANCSATGSSDANEYGGAIYHNYGVNCIISSCNFINCNAISNYKSYGGAIYNNYGGHCTIMSCNFTDCYTGIRRVTSWGAIEGNKFTEDNCRYKDTNLKKDSFSYLYYLVEIAEAGSTITLDKDYTYDEGFTTDGITVSKLLTIDGNNHILDAKSKSRIFYLNFDKIVLKNIIFVNVSIADRGGAVYIFADKCNISSCDFVNCSATSSYGYGGAICNDGGHCTISSCNFTNCDANSGGAIHSNGNCIISSCNFTNCDANSGGAIYNKGDNCIISSCNFTDCYSSTRRVTSWGAIEGSKFTEDNCRYKDTNLKKDSFSYLYYLVEIAEAGSTITLDKDYTYDEGFTTDGITVSKSLTIDGNNHILDAKSKSRIFKLNSNNIVLKNMILIGGSSGGAIYSNGANCTISSCDFANCRVTGYGGAIYSNGANCIISSCDFANCSATNKYSGHGGAIYSNGANCTISSCDFANCSATGSYGYGGAIYSNGANCTISSCDFANCSATGYGGAIYNNYGDNCIISSCNFTDCYSSTRRVTSWGAIEGNKFTEDNCRYKDTNLKKDSFSYLYYLVEIAEAGSTITLDKDYTYDEGFTTDGITVSKSLTIDGNNHILDAKSKSGIFMLMSSNIVLKNMILIGGSSGSGGAIYSNGANCTISSCDFVNCSATGYGGAIYNYGDNCIISSCNFTNCHANGVGGGAIMIYGSEDCSILYCNFINCYTAKVNTTGEGAICIEKCNVTVKNCTYIDSYAIATVIVSSPVTTVYNGGKYLIATLKDSEGNALSGFEVSVDLNGVKTLTTDTNGQVKVSTNGLIPKTYDVLIIFAGNENYTASNATTQVVVNKDSTKLTAIEVITVYNVDNDLIVTLTDGQGNVLSGFDVSVDLNGVKTLTTDTNGQVKVSTNGLIPKTYDVLITFAGNENYTASNATTQVVVNKDSTKLAASAVTTVYNVNKNLVITLKDSQGKALNGVIVSVNLNGAKTYTTKNGQVKIAVGSLVPKTYTAKISFAGNDNYNATSANVKVTVKKATPKLTAKAKTFKKSVKTKKYTVTLKTNQNKVMKNTKVTLKVNGKTYSAKTNAKGQATFKITKLTKKGKFTAVVKFAGDKYYNAKTVNAKITVK